KDNVFREEEKIDERDHTEALHKTGHARDGVPCGNSSGGWLVRYNEEQGGPEYIYPGRERRIRDYRQRRNLSQLSGFPDTRRLLRDRITTIRRLGATRRRAAKSAGE